jgi:plastocyanin
MTAFAVFGMLTALAAQAALAVPVTVSVTTSPGAPAQDVVVVFDPLDAAPPPTHGTAVIDQIDRTFVPRVSVVRTGTSITFPNSDHIRHQVYSFSPAKTFSIKLYAGSPKTSVDFDHPGLVVLGCNIHDKMVAFIGVVDSPYFAKTPASGVAALDMPSGRYRMRLWHEHARTAVPTRDVIVGADAFSLAIKMDIDPDSTRASDWPG